jgi:hypothetical protein
LPSVRRRFRWRRCTGTERQWLVLKRLQKGAKPVSTSRRLALCTRWAVLLGMAFAKVSAQSAAPQDSHCFTIQVRLNGKTVDGPQVITLKTKQNESKASLEGGCFRVPPALSKEKAIDVIFTVPRNKVYLSAIATGFFAGPWVVDLEDKGFGKGALPKHARAKEACAVEFDDGEPGTGIVETPCRTPLPDTATKTAHPPE